MTEEKTIVCGSSYRLRLVDRLSIQQISFPVFETKQLTHNLNMIEFGASRAADVVVVADVRCQLLQKVAVLTRSVEQHIERVRRLPTNAHDVGRRRRRRDAGGVARNGAHFAKRRCETATIEQESMSVGIVSIVVESRLSDGNAHAHVRIVEQTHRRVCVIGQRLADEDHRLASQSIASCTETTTCCESTDRLNVVARVAERFGQHTQRVENVGAQSQSLGDHETRNDRVVFLESTIFSVYSPN